MAYHRILPTVACAVQQDPVVHPPLSADSTMHNSRDTETT